jgi:hypothetical protein
MNKIVQKYIHWTFSTQADRLELKFLIKPFGSIIHSEGSGLAAQAPVQNSEQENKLKERNQRNLGVPRPSTSILVQR